MNGMCKSSGFSYLAMLLLIAVLSVALTKTYERTDTIAKREKEKELFFVGNQYKQAIMNYYNQSPGGFKELPKSIDDLLRDARFVETKRHLRRRFMDPITGEHFSVMLDENKRIKGVASTSSAEILQMALFGEGALTVPAASKPIARIYSDVKFEYIKEAQPANVNAGNGELQENPFNSEINNDL